MRATNDSDPTSTPPTTRFRRNQSDPTRPRCSVDGCYVAAWSRGWCPNHYSAWQRHGDPLGLHPRSDPDARRAGRDAFWHANVDKSGGSDACWPWRRKLTKGYGQMRGYDRSVTAYRFGYELLVGPAPDGLQLDHTCHDPKVCTVPPLECPHRACCNPAHLEPVTGRVNRSRGDTSRPHNGGRLRT